ncbi:MAG: TadE/TadG family type IV pilus assembly protein [Asticcacaulis sp.]
MRSLIKALTSLSLRLRNDTRGNISTIAAITLIPTVLMIGSGLDYSTAISNKSLLQDKLDAAMVSASLKGQNKADRVSIAEKAFYAQLTPEQKAMVKSLSIKVDDATYSLVGSLTAKVPTTFMSLGGLNYMDIKSEARVLIAKEEVRQLDLVFCIDATGSMQNTINAVKANALAFEANLNAELVKRGIPSVDLMRVRAIYYRDYGGYSTNYGLSYLAWNVINYGDSVPLLASDFFTLPAQSSNFHSFIGATSAWGGGDLPESGHECINAAMDSNWGKVGDTIPSSGKKVEITFPTIVVWTDAETQPVNHGRSTQHRDYPLAPVLGSEKNKMPRNFNQLEKKWNDSAVIDQSNKSLIFFGNMDRPNWSKVKAWNNVTVGGTLTEGNTKMVTQIAEVLAVRMSKPRIAE